MKYSHTLTGVFLSRPNRFIAHVDVGGKTVVCHVKNTGRCRELLLPGVKVVLEGHPGWEAAGRKTGYDLIAVYKGERLINMDSQAPNQAAWEWITSPAAPGLLCPGGRILEPRREVRRGDSRFDLAFTLALPSGTARPAFMEVKGVTLEENGIAMFPDAPTERGIKHLHGLQAAVRDGYMAWVLFVVQMKGMRLFTPNVRTHPAFGEALKNARNSGVGVLAVDCLVGEDFMVMDQEVAVRI